MRAKTQDATLLSVAIGYMLPAERIGNGFVEKDSLMNILMSFRYVFLVAILSVTSVALSACEEEGAGEKLGKSLDNAVDDMEDAIDEAME